MSIVRRFGMLVALCAALAAITGSHAHAQQNLFNVPSAEVTAKGGLFFQQQFNFDAVTQSNTTLSYGLGNDFEIGMNVLQLELVAAEPTPRENNDALYMFNALKTFELNETFKLGIGTQIGQSVPDSPVGPRFANFTYMTAVASLPDDRGKLYVGPYYANHTYRGPTGDDFGYMVGFEIPVGGERFSLMGDYISGTSGISVAVLGGVVKFGENWQFSAGAQFPSPGSPNDYGLVIELTFIPHPSPAAAAADD